MAKRHGRHTGKASCGVASKRPDATSVLRAARIGREGVLSLHRKEKEAIAAGRASLTLVPVSIAAPAPAMSSGSTARAAGESNCRREKRPGWLNLLRHLP